LFRLSAILFDDCRALVKQARYELVTVVTTYSARGSNVVKAGRSYAPDAKLTEEAVIDARVECLALLLDMSTIDVGIKMANKVKVPIKALRRLHD
jgi:hypothetical protein